jgi:hypothetical protein
MFFAESIEFIEDQQVVSLFESSCVSPDELTAGRGGDGRGKEPNQESLVLFSSLACFLRELKACWCCVSSKQ